MKTYPINEIFYSLQGEGLNAGCPAVFVRFSGCNLKCAFCDTNHTLSARMSADEILAQVRQFPAELVVLTGGEPSLFVDEQLTNALHAAGKFIAVETNGTHVLPDSVDFVTCSPKFAFCANAPIVQPRIDELKVILDGKTDMAQYENISARHFFVQPCDVGDAVRNAEITRLAVDFCMKNPKWRLSFQLHKVLNIR